VWSLPLIGLVPCSRSRHFFLVLQAHIRFYCKTPNGAHRQAEFLIYFYDRNRCKMSVASRCYRCCKQLISPQSLPVVLPVHACIVAPVMVAVNNMGGRQAGMQCCCQVHLRVGCGRQCSSTVLKD
jgi:hypothetical protein